MTEWYVRVDASSPTEYVTYSIVDGSTNERYDSGSTVRFECAGDKAFFEVNPAGHPTTFDVDVAVDDEKVPSASASLTCAKGEILFADCRDTNRSGVSVETGTIEREAGP